MFGMKSTQDDILPLMVVKFVVVRLKRYVLLFLFNGLIISFRENCLDHVPGVHVFRQSGIGAEPIVTDQSAQFI